MLIAVVGLLMGEVAFAEESQDAEVRRQVRFFENHVRPLLSEHCFRCHAGRQRKGGLRLNSRDGLLTGGDSGPAIVPGKPQDSLLIEAVNYESFEMPPDEPLDDEQIRVLTEWIASGAVWPETYPTAPDRSSGDSELFTAEERNWWAFQPVTDPQPPTATVIVTADDSPEAEQPLHPIDAFVRARQAENGLTPAGPAEPETLLRRLYFDLTGLPPTPEEVDAWLADTAPDRFERLVDRLLDSPRYGEHWARHWLDLVRYADSDGYRADHYRPNAWRYRDYVIDSLNADKPWDRFVQEQLAGDELFPDDPAALTATGYLRHGIYEYNNRDVRGQWEIIINEVTDTTGDVFLGLGMQCARCHDHKFDPILQRDYFALRAFFEPLQWRDDTVVAPPDRRQQYAEQQQAWEQATSKLRDEIAEITAKAQAGARRTAVKKFPEDIQAIMALPESERSPRQQQLHELAWRQVIFEYGRLDNRIKGEQKDRLLALRKQLAEFDDQKPAALPTAFTAGDVSGTAPPTVIPGTDTAVDPAFLTVMDPPPPNVDIAVPHSTGRRAALARWITRPDNPLTTRVIVNRIWQYHFGRGLASNSSDFGTLGGPPSHPQLLDWLTRRFVENGMRHKPLHRLIVTSDTWRQSAAHPRLSDYQRIDPDNRYYWRGSTRRLTAEQIRDAILLVTGQLDLTAGGPGVQPDVPRRSVYLRVMRNDRDSLLEAFDLPLFFNSTASRDTTTSPIQSLLLFNSRFMLQHAAALSASLDKQQSPEQRIAAAWKRTFGRDPDSHELAAARQFLRDHERVIEAGREQRTLTDLPVARLPYRNGQSILLEADAKRDDQLQAPSTAALETGDFTVEAWFQIRSIFDSGAVRTIAATSDGNRSRPGWTFGITGRGSRRRPQTLVMQMFGRDAKGNMTEAAIFSDQHVQLNTPYYAAAVVRMGQGGDDGSVTFWLKDLSNDDEPIGRADRPHALRGPLTSRLPVTIGSRAATGAGQFDGLIDEVRVAGRALDLPSLLYTSTDPAPETEAWWQFEPDPGLFEDSSDNQHSIIPSDSARQTLKAEDLAMIDFCHALLNSSQFLYVD